MLDDQTPRTAETYGVIGASTFVGEPVILTVTALNAKGGDWTDRIQWSVTSEAGEAVAVKIERTDDSAAAPPFAHRMLPNARFAHFRMGVLPPGRYIVSLSWTDPETGELQTSRRDGVAIYRGDESPRVRSFFFREQAKAALAGGTLEGYRRARDMLLEAAAGNTDPSVYEELADASAPWVSPEETAGYYQRSLEIARENLQKHYGGQSGWPARARELFERRARKVEAFRSLLPYYKENFDRVRVVVQGGKFTVERRSDGATLRVIDLRDDHGPVGPYRHM